MRPESMSALRADSNVAAAIDLGTNSFHLIVARIDAEGRFDVLASEKEMVRLGSGSGDMHVLADDAMERGIDALMRFAGIAGAFDAPITAVATSALREASNRAAFLERARIEAGIEIDVIPGVEEARLIHLGVIQALPVFDEQVLVIDIGGGSTEFLVGRGREVRSAHSTRLGAIRLTDRFFPGGRVKAKAVRDCRAYVRSLLVPTIRRVREYRPFLTIGSSGTINTLGAMAVARRGGDPSAPTNGVVFTRDELAAVVDDILSRPDPEDRRGIDGLEDKRVDIIVGGAILLEQILDGLAIESMTMSEAALREGVLLDLAMRNGDPSFDHLSDIRRQSVLRMAENFHEDIAHIETATALALALFDALDKIHGLDHAARDLLEAASLLHNVGLFISHAAHHKHSYYVIRHSDQLAGFTGREIELIAQIARYHRKSAPKSSHVEFVALSTDDQAMVRTLAGMLRIAIALDRTRHGGVTGLTATADDETVDIHVEVQPGFAYSLEEYTATERRDLLERAIDREVRLHFHDPAAQL
jgi:exopolyphosphatase/guanosine-5'-triphosphate,3'-diphosphate pyrophosphatase